MAGNDAGAFPPGWRVVPASVVGAMHVNFGIENQDAIGYRRLGDGFVVAVADGAGSAPRSAAGARLAVDAAEDAAVAIFGGTPTSPATFAQAGREFVRECLRRYDTGLTTLARAWGTEVTDFATTLLVVVGSPPYFYYLNIGDGFLVVSHRGGGVHLIAAPTGEGNRTVFLTSPARASALEQGLLLDDEVDGIALCSDGMAEAVLAAGGQGRYVVPPAFEGYFRAFAARESDPSELTRRLLSPDFAATSGDDKSMVMVVKG